MNTMHSSADYKPTFVLMALTIGFYVYTSIAGGDFLVTSDSMVWQWGQVNALVFEGWYWQLFTSIFVHADIVHLAGNMLFLLIFGLRAEEMFSLPEYATIYILGGLTGNLLSLLMGPYFSSVGASGAIFALFGACVIYDRRTILGALIYAFFLLIISSGPEVNYLAHFGGLAAGLIIGYLLASRRKEEIRYQVRYGYRMPI